MKRRLAAILVTDVVGYTRLMGDDEAGTLTALKNCREELISPKIVEHQGRLVKLMGDGALVEFASAVDALACASDIQKGMAVRNQEAGRIPKITFRIGINIGDIIVEDDDIYGDGVNLASRLEGIAEPGGICISDNVYVQVKNKLPLNYQDLGLQSLKNVAEPVQVYLVSPKDVAGSMDTNATVSPAIPHRPSIAVLPFDNMSADPEQEFLADGITEDLITGLSKIRWFFVISRTSTFTYKGQSVEVKQVAKELGVRYVLEGSVRKAGNRVRITAQLIDATTGHHVWAERYDRELADVFDLQDEMTQTLVGAIEPELSAVERDRASRKPPENLDAWENYQRGLWNMWSYRRDELKLAHAHFKRATKLDSNFAPAFAYWSYSHYQSVIMGWSDDDTKSLDDGMKAAEKALALDDQDPIAYFAAGRIHMMQGNHDASIASLETSIRLNPSFNQAYHGLGMVLTLSDRLDDAKAALLQSERLSPRDPITWASTVVHALACVLSGDHEEALHWANITIRNPRSSGYWPHALMAASLSCAGRIDEAREQVEAACKALPDFSLSYLEKTFPTKVKGGLDPYLNALRNAGLKQ